MIRIFHTSDLHDHRGFAPRIRQLREKQPGFYFDCGDSLRGSQTVYHGREPIISELDEAGCDAQAVGNREFHYFFPLMRARAKKMRHPLVCTNLVDLRGRALPFVPSLQFQADAGRTLHVLGLTVPQYPPGSFWERLLGWRFVDAIEALGPYVKKVPTGDALVLLSHVGLRMDRELARRIPRLDLILGGHSHDTLSEPEFVAGVPIVHAGPYGHYASRTELSFNPHMGKFTVTNARLVPLLQDRV